VQEQLIELKQEVQERQAQDDTERDKMQDLMSRLEANGISVAEKQKEIEERETIIREAGNDVQVRLEELITLVRRCQLADVPA
jgi:predicted  nucleic acid-binding Zn-ribbon protein